MTKAADLFVVPTITRCPAAPAENSGLPRTVCHQHVEVQRTTILVWTAISTFVSLIAGLVLTWIHDNGYSTLLDKDTLVQIVNELLSVRDFLGYFTWVGLVVFLAIWAIATLLVCTRQFITIREYVLLGMAMPISVMSFLSPLF